LPRDRDYQKRGVLRCRTPLEKLTSGLPKGSPSRPERCLNANRQSDSFTSLEIAPRNSNHIPGGTAKGTTVVPTLRGAWTGGQRVGPRCAVLARLYVRDGSWLCENADVRKPMEGSSLRTACKSRSTALNAAGRAAHKHSQTLRQVGADQGQLTPLRANSEPLPASLSEPAHRAAAARYF
jgi:hypothetical protein